MTVIVKLFATLARNLPPGAEGHSARVDLGAGVTVAQLLKHLEVPEGQAKLILVDGVHRSPDTVLRDGDTVSVFPPIAGG